MAQNFWEMYNLLEHSDEAKAILNASKEIFRQLNPAQSSYSNLCLITVIILCCLCFIFMVTASKCSQPELSGLKPFMIINFLFFQGHFFTRIQFVSLLCSIYS